jgi:protein TonB
MPAPQPAAPVPAPQPPPEPEPAVPEVKRGQLVNPGPGVVAPRLVRRASPSFPPAAARLNREATVDVRVLVDETGKVIEAEVEGRRAGMGFDEEALQAARSSAFEPATKFDVPVKMWSTMRFVFKK